VPYLSEVEHDEEIELLRLIEKDLGVSGVVPPATGPTNAPVATPTLDPGPVATPEVGHFTPPVSAPEHTNAFAPTFAPR